MAIETPTSRLRSISQCRGEGRNGRSQPILIRRAALRWPPFSIDKSPFQRQVESCHGLPHVPPGSAKGQPFVFWGKMALVPFTKPHATPAQRISHLRAKGLIIARPNVAAKKIEAIGYERLRIYFLSRRQLHIAGRPFNPGTTYQDIIQLYECDAALRDVCFSAVGQFELLFRNLISETLSQTYGSHPYFDISAFRDAAANINAIQTCAKVYNSSKDRRAKHYKENYNEPILPPVWTLKEFLTFGASSVLYKSLSGPIRTSISSQFGVSKDDIFTQWVDCLVDLRNICAHHDRLFNRSFQKQPSKLIKSNIPTAPIKKLKAILECLDYMLSQRGMPASTVSKVKTTIDRYPQVIPSEAGY